MYNLIGKDWQFRKKQMTIKTKKSMETRKKDQNCECPPDITRPKSTKKRKIFPTNQPVDRKEECKDETSVGLQSHDNREKKRTQLCLSPDRKWKENNISKIQMIYTRHSNEQAKTKECKNKTTIGPSHARSDRPNPTEKWFKADFGWEEVDKKILNPEKTIKQD